MSPSPEVNEATRREWRELGFFYERDDSSKAWLICGSRIGLMKFAKILENYADDPRNRTISEHEHYGPYGYLEIGTWRGAEITDHWIAGTLEDLQRLAGMVRASVATALQGERTSLGDVYAPRSPYNLLLEVHDDNFDPARADLACW